jgi:hypothetical protein
MMRELLLEALPSGYRRRQPEKTALHEVGREHLESLLVEVREEGRGLPRSLAAAPVDHGGGRVSTLQIRSAEQHRAGAKERERSVRPTFTTLGGQGKDISFVLGARRSLRMAMESGWRRRICPSST